jgi:hypothetical protein
MTSDALDELLARWAASYRLSAADVAAVREAVRLSASTREQITELDAEWLWDLMRPVTRLLDGPRPLIDTLMRGYA